jgi:hypothetical protein
MTLVGEIIQPLVENDIPLPAQTQFAAMLKNQLT